MPDAMQPPKRKNRLLIGLIVAAIIVLVACTAIFALIFSQVGQIANTEVPAMQQTVDAFIRAGGKADVAAGYALFAPEARQQFTQEDVQKMFAEAQLFDQFQSTKTTNFNINTNATAAGGSVTTAQLDGTIAYGDGKGTYEAELMKVGDRWLLININLKIEPAKLKAWQDAHPQ
jgi:flagellar basal body-associated protein FliL